MDTITDRKRQIVSATLAVPLHLMQLKQETKTEEAAICAIKKTCGMHCITTSLPQIYIASGNTGRSKGRH